MDERNYNRNDPWDQGVYETGRTKPPKSYGSLIALLLVVVIFLGGLVTVLSLLNVKLFAQLQDLSRKEEKDPFSLITETEPTEEELSAFDPSAHNHSEEVLPTEVHIESFFLNPSPDSVPNVVQDGGLSLQEIYEKNIPSVVSISCQQDRGSSTGTGVILTSSGYIVTNAHVVDGARSISVTLTDERSFIATLIGSDAVSDLAVLHVEADNLTPAEFGDSGILRVGDSVAAIGDPLGKELRGTLTNGIVSAINRDVTTGGRTLTLIQTNAALNSGNSGGPLINCFGQVIGINTLKIGDFVDMAGVEGLGFAIPSTTVKEIVEQLIDQGYVSGRPTLGITGEAVSTFYQYYYRMPAGLYITELEDNSDAALKGMEEGDILISVDGNRITDTESLQTLLYNYEVGDTVNVIIYRGGRQYTADLTLHESKG